jgi:hypothetical protein
MTQFLLIFVNHRGVLHALDVRGIRAESDFLARRKTVIDTEKIIDHNVLMIPDNDFTARV